MKDEMELKEEQEVKKAVKDLYDLQAEYCIKQDKYSKYIDAIDKVLGIEHTLVDNVFNKDKPDIYKQLSHNEYTTIKHARKILDLKIQDDITVVLGRKEQYTIRILLEIIDELLKRQFNNNELTNQVNMLQKMLKCENNRCSKLAMLNTELRETINNYLDSLPHNIIMTYRPPSILTELLKKGNCTEKQWNDCRVEKMGCEGCIYDDYSGKNEIQKMRPLNYSKEE